MNERDTAQAASYAKQFFKDTFDVAYLAGGTSSAAYKVTAPGYGPLVMLVELASPAHAVDYGNNFAVLKLLEKNQYKYAPKVYWLSNDHKALIMDKVPGKSLDDFDFTQAGVDKKAVAHAIVDAAYETYDVKHEDYLAVCAEHDIQPMAISSAADSIQIHYVDKFEKSQQLLGEDNEYIRWLQPKYDAIIKHPLQPQADTLVFEHSDLSNPNIIVDADTEKFNVYFVDWGSAHFSYSGPEFYIGYMTQLVDFMAKNRAKLIEYTARKLNLDPAEFLQITTAFRKELKVADIIWAVMMYALCHSGENSQDEDTYLKITQQRIREYEEEFDPHK